MKSWTVTVRTDRVSEQAHDGAAKGLFKALEHILGVSNDHVPIEEGVLERSGTTSVDGLRGAVAYDTVYAVEMHENMTARHDPGRTSKYLENAMNAERDTAGKIVAAEIRKALGT